MPLEGLLAIFNAVYKSTLRAVSRLNGMKGEGRPYMAGDVKQQDLALT